MKRTAMQKELDAIRDAAEKAEQEVIAKYRDKYVVPYCDKYNIKLLAGMGTWALIDEQGRQYGTEWEGRPIPIRVRETLMAEVLNRSQDAGSLMQDYVPKGWERKYN